MTDGEVGRLASKEKYVEMAKRYLENGLRFLKKNEAEKASEMLWGSAAQAVKAVAAKGGRELRAHHLLSKFVRELSKERQEPELFVQFDAIQWLHSNFYESELTVEDVIARLEIVKKFVRRMLGFAKTAGHQVSKRNEA